MKINAKEQNYIIADKYTAAAAQIDAAIELYFTFGNQIAIHSLMSNAYNILTDLSRHGKKEPMLREFSMVKDEKLRKELIKTSTSPSNFIKHADRDPDQLTAINPVTTEIFLYECCHRYLNLVESHTMLMTLYRAWYLAFHPEFPEPNLKADSVEKIKFISETYSLDDRQLFYLRNMQQQKNSRALLLLNGEDQIELGIIVEKGKLYAKELSDMILDWANNSEEK